MKVRWREPRKFVFYGRVSTEEQAREAYGLESQLAICEDCVESLGGEIVAQFVDPGVSGWADVERPGFRDMIEYLRANRDVCLVFQDYSRFGRNTLKALIAFEQLDVMGVVSIAAEVPSIDCKTAAGRTARRDELSKAEDFSDRNSEKTSARMKAAFDEGRCCRVANYGYQNTGSRIKGQPNIVPYEEEACWVRLAFEMIRRGDMKAADVLRVLTERGMRTRKGNKFTLHTLLKLLRNVTYIGKLQSRKWRMVVQGQHEPLIDTRLFRDVQLILKGKKPVVAPYVRNREGFPLRRFLRCGVCSTPLTGGTSKSATGKTYDYYHCYKCRSVKSVATAKAEQEFIELLEQLRPDAALLAELPRIVEEEWKRRAGECGTNVRQLRARLDETRANQEKLFMGYLKRDKHIVAVYDRMNSKFEDEIALLASQIEEAESAKTTLEELQLFCRDMLVDIATAWKRANIDQKQRVQNALFENGLNYDPKKGVLNSDMDCLFSGLQSLMDGKVSLARPERFELPT